MKTALIIALVWGSIYLAIWWLGRLIDKERNAPLPPGWTREGNCTVYRAELRPTHTRRPDGRLVKIIYDDEHGTYRIPERYQSDQS